MGWQRWARADRRGATPVAVAVTALVALVAPAVPAAFGQVSAAGAATPGFTGAAFFSQSGDSLGQGLSYAFPIVAVDASASGNGQETFEVDNPYGPQQASVELAAPPGEQLTVGTYANAQLAATRQAGQPGIDVTIGDGSCSTETGSFQVFEATYNGAGAVTGFAAQFSDYCDGDSGALDGFVAYNATVAIPAWLVASTTSVSFPNTRVGTGSQSVTISMDNLGTSPVTVSGFSFGGPAADDYIGQTDCETTLEVAEVCSITLFFVPGEPGERVATVGVEDDLPTSPQFEFSGQGTVGYYIADSAGDVIPRGDAQLYGDMANQHLNAPIISMAATDGGYGYWLLGQDGGVFTFGAAAFYGSTGSMHLNKPVVSMAATPDGKGYWFVASDGGIFAFGDAAFYGSMGGKPLNQPIVGMAATPDGKGYYLVASDGGIFSFGDARFYGSTGNIHLNQPIVGMAVTPDGKGYWMVASDGGIFCFGDARYFGSTGAQPLNAPIVGMAPTWDGAGYWLLSYDGGVFSFGDAPYMGAAVGPGSEGGVSLVGTAPPTPQAQLDLPALRTPALRAGWRLVEAPRR